MTYGIFEIRIFIASLLTIFYDLNIASLHVVWFLLLLKRLLLHYSGGVEQYLEKVFSYTKLEFAWSTQDGNS